MRYNGRGNPLAVLVSCLTLGWLPLILFVLFLVWLPLWVYGVVACIAMVAWVLWELNKESNDESKND